MDYLSTGPRGRGRDYLSTDPTEVRSGAITIPLTAAEIRDGVVKAAIPALGTGRAPLIATAAIRTVPGSVPFGSAQSVSLQIDEVDVAVSDAPVDFDSADGQLALLVPPLTSSIYPDDTAVEVVVPAAGDPGAIGTVAIEVAGTGYEEDDVLTLAGGTGGTVVVDAVDGSGAITAVSVGDRGTGYEEGVAAASGGAGADAEIDILTLAPANGTAKVYVTWNDVGWD